MIKNLKLPLKVISGEICDANGKSILLANRESKSPLKPTERDALMHLVAKLINKSQDKVSESLNEDTAQLGDKVLFNKQKGFVIGQSSDGQYIIQMQGNTAWAKPADVKVLNVKAKAMEVPMKFDTITQKVLLEQFIRCGIFMGNTPIKTTNCFVQYSEWAKAQLHENVNVIADGHLNIMVKENVRIFEDVNNFANPEDYIEGVIVDEFTNEAKESVLINAIDYTSAIGDSDGVRVIRGIKTENPQMENLPKIVLKTLSI